LRSVRVTIVVELCIVGCHSASRRQSEMFRQVMGGNLFPFFLEILLVAEILHVPQQ
jgi:hypothetical protein